MWRDETFTSCARIQIAVTHALPAVIRPSGAVPSSVVWLTVVKDRIMGCLTVFFRLLTQALLARAVTAIVDSLFGGKLGQAARKALEWVLGRLKR